MKLSEFNNSFLTILLEKISFEKKIITLLGDFNANLIHYHLDRDMSDFLDLMYSTALLTTNYNTISYNFKMGRVAKWVKVL